MVAVMPSCDLVLTPPPSPSPRHGWWSVSRGTFDRPRHDHSVGVFYALMEHESGSVCWRTHTVENIGIISSPGARPLAFEAMRLVARGVRWPGFQRRRSFTSFNHSLLPRVSCFIGPGAVAQECEWQRDMETRADSPSHCRGLPVASLARMSPSRRCTLHGFPFSEWLTFSRRCP